MEFSMALKQPSILAVLGEGGEGLVSGEVHACGGDRVPRNRATDQIAQEIVQEREHASSQKASRRSHRFRSYLIESCELTDDWKLAPITDEAKRRNVQRPEYSKVQAGLIALVLDFLISFIRAMYGDRPHYSYPGAKRPCGADPIPFASGPFDALTVFCLDVGQFYFP